MGNVPACHSSLCPHPSSLLPFLKSFGLLDKRSLVFKGITDYHWSPTDHLVAYWVPEQGANPAKVALIQLPSRTEIRSKNLFQVSEVSVVFPPPERCQLSVKEAANL